MRRCKICKSTNDVRGDGICMGCYAVRRATAAGMSYGKYVAMYGHNFRRGNGERQHTRLCPVCGMVIANRRRGTKYCSDVCRSTASYYRTHPDPQPRNRKSCRGCRWYVVGSSRCTNKNSQMFDTSIGKGCTQYERLVVDDG